MLRLQNLFLFLVIAVSLIAFFAPFVTIDELRGPLFVKTFSISEGRSTYWYWGVTLIAVASLFCYNRIRAQGVIALIGMIGSILFAGFWIWEVLWNYDGGCFETKITPEVGLWLLPMNIVFFFLAWRIIAIEINLQNRAVVNEK